MVSNFTRIGVRRLRLLIPVSQLLMNTMFRWRFTRIRSMSRVLSSRVVRLLRGARFIRITPRAQEGDTRRILCVFAARRMFCLLLPIPRGLLRRIRLTSIWICSWCVIIWIRIYPRMWLLPRVGSGRRRLRQKIFCTIWGRCRLLHRIVRLWGAWGRLFVAHGRLPIRCGSSAVHCAVMGKMIMGA